MEGEYDLGQGPQENQDENIEKGKRDRAWKQYPITLHIT